jgi:putative zinc finger/helix-turn-helix YgiT family protein
MEKKASSKRIGLSHHGGVSDNACPACEATMVAKRGTLRVPVNGEEIPVPSAAHLHCPKCGEIVLRYQDAQRLGEDAIDIYRQRHGLLLAGEIRAIREGYGLTQADLARLLHLGANTISRWESGRNVQTGAMDMLLRLIRNLPGSMEYMREHAIRRTRQVCGVADHGPNDLP